jgi:hypothetical protein
MKGCLAAIAAWCGIVILVLGLTWLAQGNDFFMYRFFGIRYENARREIFEQSKAYRQGMVQELQNMLFEYEQADAKHQSALASIILHRAADVPDDAMPSDLRSSIQQLRQQERDKR